jgi:type I restriction enzyme, S subunit
MPDQLPKGWVKTTLGEIRRNDSLGISQQEMRGETFELYSVPAFTDGKPETVAGDQVGSNKVLVAPGDTLVCKINPRINRAWVVGESHGHRQIASTEWIVFSKQEGIVSEFLRYYFMQDTFRNYLAGNVSGVGGSLMRVRPAVVEKYHIQLPPTQEQERIVAQLDTLLSRVAAGESAARRALDRLQRYRSAVLQGAVTGELTRDWRKTHQTDETGPQLLKRLLQERRDRWEDTELQRLRASGKSPKDEKWKSRYPEPRLPEADTLPRIPRTWGLVSIHQLGWKSGYGTSVKCTYDANGPAVLRIPNIRNGAFDFSDLKFATRAKEISDDDFVAPGDLVLIRTNGSIDLIGRAAVAKSALKRKCSFASYLIRFRLVGDKRLWSWISVAWESHNVRSAIQSRAATTAGQYNVSLSGLADLALPLPPLPEQTEIVLQVERRLTAADRLTIKLDHQLDRARITRQSLLREAFTGKLVQQHSNEEPASVLLQRLRASRRDEAKKPISKRMPRIKSKVVRRPLLEILRSHKRPISPEQLFRESGFQREFESSEYRQEVVDDFYEELRMIVAPRGPVTERRPNSKTVLLEVTR